MVTGLLVSSYDEEFRRLYARSVVPEVFTKTGFFGKQENNALALAYQNTFSGQKHLHTRHYSLNHLHLKSREKHSPGGAHNDRAMLSRGLSVQDKLHQPHFNDTGYLLRGHSYDEDLQKIKTMTRMKMGTRGLRVSAAPERMGSKLKDGSKQTRQQPTNRPSRQLLRHQTRYGADQNLIPFNSETSLHKWKMEAYINENDMPLDASADVLSPEKSSQSKHKDLSEYQTQLIRRRSKEIRSKLEEMRQKRHSLQESANLRQSRESLRSVRSERIKYISLLTGPEMNQTVLKLDPDMKNKNNLKSSELKKAKCEMGQGFTDDQRSFSHHDIKKFADQENIQEQARCRTKSDAGLNVKQSDSVLKFSQLNSTGVQHSRIMKSLTEIPEEKEVSNTHVIHFDSVHSMLVTDEKEISKKQKSRRVSMRSQSTSEPNQAPRTDHSQECTVNQATAKGQVPGISRSQNSLNGHSETDHRKSPFSRLSPQRLSKRKTTPSAEQDQGSRNPLNDDGASVSQIKNEQPVPRYEIKFRKNLMRVEKLDRVPDTMDKQKGSSLNRQDNDNQMCQTQAGNDNKLGRFMQRVGNLINKNK